MKIWGETSVRVFLIDQEKNVCRHEQIKYNISNQIQYCREHGQTIGVHHMIAFEKGRCRLLRVKGQEYKDVKQLGKDN